MLREFYSNMYNNQCGMHGVMSIFLPYKDENADLKPEKHGC